MSSLKAEERRRLISMLSAGTTLDSLAYNRFQESEADHIGLFLMTFAGYDPRAALTFWERMSAISSRRGRLPEILSDHPSDERRIAQLKAWIPLAEGGKKAFDQGMVAPER
jgi:predicted Zn-dependent protease